MVAVGQASWTMEQWVSDGKLSELEVLDQALEKKINLKAKKDEIV